MDPKQVALSMIIHGDLFWVHLGRALRAANAEQTAAILETWPKEYGRFEQSARRLAYEYRLSCQLELVMRSLNGTNKTWKLATQKAQEMDFSDLSRELEQRKNFRLLLDLARRFGVSNKSNEELVDTAVN